MLHTSLVLSLGYDCAQSKSKLIRIVFTILSVNVTLLCFAERVLFDVESGSALETLKEAAAQAEVPFIYIPQILQGVTTQAVYGEYEPIEAFELMLNGTSLTVIWHEQSGAFTLRRAPNGRIQNDNSVDMEETTKLDKSKVNAKKKNWSKSLALILTLGFSVNLDAQESDSEEGLYTLSPFVVSEGNDVGYLSANTLGATRTNTALKDLPFQINVLSSELIEDTASYNVDQAIDYMPGVSLVFNEFVPLYSIRGFVSSAAMRNGIRSLNKPDAIQIARVEAVKGPAALLYGQSQPGGVLNYITKQPHFQPSHSVSYTIGNNNLSRATLSTTGPIGEGERFAYRVDASYHDQGRYEYFQDMQRYSVSPMFSIRFNPKTDLMLSFNKQKETNVPSGGLPLKPNAFRISPKTHWVTELGFDHTKDSPYSSRNMDTTIYEAQLRHNFAEGVDFRLNYSNMNRKRDSIREGGTGLLNGTYVPGVTGLRRTAFPADIRDQDRENIQADLAWRFGMGELSHQLVLGFETNDENEWQNSRWWAGNPELYGINPDDYPEYSQSSGGVFTRFTYDVFDAASTLRRDNFIRDHMPKSAYDMPVRPNGTRDNFFNTSAFYANWQITWNEEKGRVLLGGRMDDVEHDRIRYVTEGDPALGTVRVTSSVSSRLSGEVDHFSPQAGISYEVSDGWTLYALYSKSVNPRFGLNPARSENAELALIDAAADEGLSPPDPNTLPWGALYDPETGVGYELGFRYAPDNNQMGITVALYDIEKQDIVRGHSDVVLAAAGFQELSGVESSKGVDVDFHLNLLEGRFQVVGGYTYADTEQVTARPGLPVRWAAKDQGNVWGNYRFENGLSIGLGLTGVSPRLEDSDTRISPGFYRLDGRIGYATEVGGTPTEFNLNIRNLEDKEYRLQRDAFGVPLEYMLTVKVRL